AVVEVELRVDGVQSDAMPELTEARDRTLAFRGSEVVEDAARHQEVGRRGTGLRLELGEPERRVEREVDVVTKQEIARGWFAVEESECVVAGLCRVEQLAVVHEVERAVGHSTTTSSSVAAASARSSASMFVSPTAIT